MAAPGGFVLRLRSGTDSWLFNEKKEGEGGKKKKEKKKRRTGVRTGNTWLQW